MNDKITLGALWQFPEHVQTVIIENHLSHYGRMIRNHPYSAETRIVTFDRGERCSPRFMVAKGLVGVAPLVKTDFSSG
jgi:hypothetical protein